MKVKVILLFALVTSAACIHGVSSNPEGLGSPDANGIKNPVSWSARSGLVTLSADDFYIVAGGTKYLGNVQMVDVHSDPGDTTYTTLELTWMENGVEMRLYMYFHADGTHWWSNELRTYNGLPGMQEDWIYYHGTFFDSPVGSSFTGNLDFASDPMSPISGSIHFEHLQLKVTFS